MELGGGEGEEGSSAGDSTVVGAEKLYDRILPVFLMLRRHTSPDGMWFAFFLYFFGWV